MSARYRGRNSPQSAQLFWTQDEGNLGNKGYRDRGGIVTSIKEDILSFAAENPGFNSGQIIQHLFELRGTVNPANVTTTLKTMADRGDLERSETANIHRPRYRYWLAQKEAAT